LRKVVKQPLIVNQMQWSLAESRMVDAGLNVNTGSENGVMREGGVLEFCRAEGIAIQAWSPLQFGPIQGVFLNNPAYAALNTEIGRLAGQYGVSDTAVALAWILRHPAAPQVITGTVSRRRIPALLEAGRVELTRPEWYGLYRAAGNPLP
ncbi:MAG: aldo/keto reductase, partial [Oscillospiraceae bacterium]|nr:aldo/keto reductase [Oscillospiraceae bacterium]